MATKTISSGESSRGYTFKLVMNETTDIETNTSSISWQLQLSLKSGSGWSFYDFGVGWEAYINGVRVAYHNRASSDRYTLTAGNTWTMASGTTSVVHDTDGTKTIQCSASMDMATSPSGAGPMSLSGSWELTTIPRASSLTIPTLTIGSSATLSITAASNTFSHEISYVMSDLSGSIASLSAGVSSTTWTPPTSFYAKIPNATQGNVTITLDTYTGDTLVGSASYTVPVLVGSSVKPTTPTITTTPVNTNAWLNSQGLYVGDYSRIRVQTSASPGTGATIVSYQISGAFSGVGADVTSGVLNAGVKTIKVTATDSRGRSTSNTVSLTFLEYSNPTLTTFSAERGLYANDVWTPDVNGNHIRINAVATVSLSDEGNTETISASVGGTSPDVISGNYFIWTSTNNTTTYEAIGTVADLVGGSSSRGLSISTVEVPFNINVELPGAAFGMIAQSPQALELSQAWHLQLGGASIPDEDEADHILKMKADGTGLEWGPVGVGGGWFDADYDPLTSEITITADFASEVIFSYEDDTSILSINVEIATQALDLSSVIFFGDSFTEGYLLSNPDTEVWCAKLAEYMNIPKWQRFGGGGCGFSHVSSSRNVTFKGYWNNEVANMNKDATTIFIMGGFNDKDQTATNVQNGMEELITTIRSTFPESQTKIVYLFNPCVCICPQSVVRACYNKAIDLNLVVYGDAWWWNFGETSLYNSDNVHPNATGHSRIARCLFTVLQGGEVYHRTALDFGVDGNRLLFLITNDSVTTNFTATKDASARYLKVGEFPAWVDAGWLSSYNAPTLHYRDFVPFETNDGVQFGWYQFGANDTSIYLISARKLDAVSTWSSGTAYTSNTYDLMEMFGVG